MTSQEQAEILLNRAANNTYMKEENMQQAQVYAILSLAEAFREIADALSASKHVYTH